MLGLARHARACPRFSKISKQQYLWERLSYFVYLLHVVTHSWKLHCYHVDLVGYGPTCPKFPEATNHQYLWKGSCNFVDFLQAVICILLDIHWSYKNMLFWAGIVRHRLSANQIVRYFKLKTWKLYEVSSWFFASIEATKNIILFWVMLENTLGQSLCRIFHFWLVWLVKLNTRGPLLHCTCFLSFVSFMHESDKKFITDAVVCLEPRQVFTMEPFGVTIFSKNFHHRFLIGF